MKAEVLILTILVLLGEGCGGIPESKNKVDYEILPNDGVESIQLTKMLEMDTLRIDGDKVSLEGDFMVSDDTLYFADQILASFVRFDKEGQYIDSWLKKGRGPGELLGLNQAVCLRDGVWGVMDQNWMITLWDRDWSNVKKIHLSFHSDKSLRELKACPDPNDVGVYEVEYAKNRLRASDMSYLFFPVTVEAEKLNAFMGSGARHYYRNAYTLAMLSLQTGKIEHLLCNRSAVYEKYLFLPNFRNVLFDVDCGKLFYSFEIDPMIYEMNLRDFSVVGFGGAGKDMYVDYRETQALEDAEMYLTEDRKNYGYYRYLNYIPEKKLLFRGYHRGKEAQTDGMQVYSEHSLIGDLDVPRDFEVFGYIKPWFYAKGANDYENETMMVYRFKLKGYE